MGYRSHWVNVGGTVGKGLRVNVLHLELLYGGTASKGLWKLC